MKRILVVIGVVFALVFGASRSQCQEGWLAKADSYSFVAKVNVKNLDKAAKWYVEKIGLVADPQFDTPTWRQLNLPGKTDVAVGLNKSNSTGSGHATTTFVVKDIVKERKALIDKGVKVGAVSNVGQEVCLAFFNDPDGNQLGLRQNKCTLPKAGK